MGVKSIFKILISVPCIIILALTITEYVNVSLQSQILKNKLKLGTDAAASLFEAENYKNYSSNSAQSPNKSDIKAADGTKYISGEFYPSEAINLSSKDALSKSIYNYMYDINPSHSFNESQDDFDGFVSTLGGNNVSLGHLREYVHSGLGGAEPTKPGAYNSYADTNAYEAAWTTYNNLYMGYLIYKNRYTPLNMGICYFDKDVLLRMAKWEVTQMVSNCDSANIVTTDKGEHYVQNHGFGIYANKMRIEAMDLRALTSFEGNSNDGLESMLRQALNEGKHSINGYNVISLAQSNNNEISYLTFDLTDGTARKWLMALTGIDAKGKEEDTYPWHISYKDKWGETHTYTLSGSTGNSKGLGLDWDNIDTDMRRYFTVAFVKYKVPISYKGITPLTRAFNWLSHNQVKGLDETEPGVLNITYSEDTSDYTFISCYYNVD